MSEAPDTAKGTEDMTVQSWPLPSLPATWGRTGPAPPRLRHSGERTTTPSGQHGRADPDKGGGVGVYRWISPENRSMGDLAPPLSCRVAAWVEERWHPRPNVWGRWESCPYPSPAAVYGRAGPKLRLGSTREPTLLVKGWVSQPQTGKRGTNVPTTPLSWRCGQGRDSSSYPHPSLPETEEWTDLTSGSTQESKPCSSPGQRHRWADPEGVRVE